MDHQLNQLNLVDVHFYVSVYNCSLDKGRANTKLNDCPIILFVLEIPYDNVISCTSKHDTYDMILLIEEIPNNHLGSIPNYVSNGISTTKPHLVVSQISSINSMTIPKVVQFIHPSVPMGLKLFNSCTYIPFSGHQETQKVFVFHWPWPHWCKVGGCRVDRHKWQWNNFYKWPSIDG